YRPLARECPFIERKTTGHCIDAASVRISRWSKDLRSLVPEIVFRRPHVAPVCGGLDALAADWCDRTVDGWPTAVGQQPSNDVFGPLVLALAELMIANLSTCIDEVQRRPILVPEGPPDRIVVVDDDRPVDSHRLHRPAHVLEIVLERELRRMYADDDDARLVPLGPGTHVRKRAQPVDARVGAEIHDHDFPCEI